MRLYSSLSVLVTLAAICICFGVVISLLGRGIRKSSSKVYETSALVLILVCRPPMLRMHLLA